MNKRRFATFALAVGLLAIACMVVAPVMAAHTPSGAQSTSSAGQFKHASPFSQNFVFDKPRIWIPLFHANIDVNTTNDGGITTTSVVRGVGTGSASVLEMASSEVNGITFDANNESASVMIPIPHDIDLAQPIWLRALVSNSEAAGTGTGKITFTYGAITTGTDAIAVAATACDTDGAAAADLAANVLQWTNWSIINGSSISDVAGEGMLLIKAKATLVTIADLTAYGIQMQYTRKWLGGDNL